MSEDMKKKILGDLGKATRRGVRRCPQCGTINGTRGLSCKNSLCDMIFKEIIEKPKKVNLDACKLITEQGSSCLSWTTIFSVRVKERCPDYYRGLVQIELEDLNRSDDSNGANPILLQLESVELTPTKGTCYVIGCPKRCILAKITRGEEVCNHIAACITRTDLSESEPFTLKHSVLNSMGISADCKQKIFMKARDGPLVQRVSPTTMVVKCDKDDLHPLGYLHTMFLKNGSQDQGTGFKFGCACSLSMPSKTKKNSSILSINMPEMHSSNTPVVKCRCLHFYSCIAAFLGDLNLAKEFSRFISDEQVVSSMQQVIAILGDDNNSIKVEVMGEENLDLFASGDPLSTKSDELDQTFRIEKFEIEGEDAHTITLPGINTDDLLGSSVVATNQVKRNGREQEAPKNHETKVQYEIDAIFQQPQMAAPPGTNALTPLDWLASVTEQINLTMHYGFADRPEPLSFRIPLAFFNFLMDRISAGTSKKRLPNSTQTIERKDRPPLGRFIKYTWLLTNIFQLKKVFDTPQVQLDISRKFTRNADGSYNHLTTKTPLNEIEAEEGKICPNKRQKQAMKHLRPVEYKTFLKVGQMSSDPRDVTPFTIEWIPDLFPKSRVGELAIKFEFGHQLNGQLDPNMLPKNG